MCLPDVSVYSELCQILGISINEFLAGEDIVRENIDKKSEENIIGLATDSKQKQKRLKYIIGILLVTAAIVVLTVGIMIFRKNMPQNFIVPVDKDSVGGTDLDISDPFKYREDHGGLVSGIGRSAGIRSNDCKI